MQIEVWRWKRRRVIEIESTGGSRKWKRESKKGKREKGG